MGEKDASPGLVLYEVSKRFGPREALRDVSLTVRSGEVVVLVGPNGAGKTTLLRIAAGITRADGGRVLVGGADLARETQAAKRRIGWASDRPLLYDDLTTAENLALFGRLYGLAKAEAASSVPGALDEVGLLHRAADPAGTLSHGLRQRASFARARFHRPSVLLLDEPFEGIDPKGQQLFLRLLRADARERGCAVLVTTHQVALGCQVADRLAVLDRGRLLKVVAREATSPADLVRELEALGGEPAAR